MSNGRSKVENLPTASIGGASVDCPADTRIRYDSRNDSWKRWHLPGDRPQPYAVYVDDTDAVWVSDWGANAILRFDPKTERFESFPLPDSYANVRQLAGRKGEAWGAESAADKLFMIKSE